MTLNEFIEDAFKKEHEYLLDAVSDLSATDMAWKAAVSYTHLTLPTNREV